jgi:gliding motility-associated-like protein
VTYLALIKNLGDVNLTNVQVTDSLAKAYSKSLSFQVVGRPFTGKNSTLKVNPNFNGNDDVNLLIADASSQLIVGQTDSLFVTISVCFGDFRVFSTNAYAKAIGNGKVVADMSSAGVVVNAIDNTPTVIEFPSNVSDLFIPSGFSPNGDGKNDTFIINIPSGAKIELFEIFNRWGQLVFKDINGVIDTSGWDGVCNQGLRLVGDSLPDGTYFYVLKLSNEKLKRISYITLAR